MHIHQKHKTCDAVLQLDYCSDNYLPFEMWKVNVQENVSLLKLE